MTQNTIRAFYKRLIALYPKSFKEKLGESMEQTFNDLCNERRQTKLPLSGFVLWTFFETAIGISREYLFLISSGEIMQNTLKTFGLSTLISFLLILPFIIMEVVNRRNFNEDFPLALFFGLWLNLFAVSLLLLPILRAWSHGKQEGTNSIATQKKTFFTNPKSTLIVSIILILSIIMLSFLTSRGWDPLEWVFNNPNPEHEVFGIRVAAQLIVLVLFSVPIAAGVIAASPVVMTLRAGGSLYAHPFHLIIVVIISFLFAAGTIGLIVSQWPCFIGVPVCD